MGQQLQSDAKIQKILDLAPISPETRSRMAGQATAAFTGASQQMSPEEQNRNLNMAKNMAAQPVEVRTDEDIEKQQQTQKTTGYVS